MHYCPHFVQVPSSYPVANEINQRRGATTYTKKPAEVCPRPLDLLVYARHGRELMGCKSPVREPMVSILMDTTKSTSRRQGREGDRPSEARLR